MPKERIELHFTGGMNNLDTGLALSGRKRGEAQLLINGSTSTPGQIRPQKPFLALNSTPGTNVRQIFVAGGIVFLQDGQSLYYLLNGVPTLLYGGLSINKFCFERVGDWVFIATGDNRKSVHVPTLAVCDWGVDLPLNPPTVAVGSSGSPNGTYNCYYRHKVTLPDGVIIRTAISPVAEVTVSSQQILWSNIQFSGFLGATTVEVELFRASTAMGALYLVTTLPSGTSTYTDPMDDSTLEGQTEYAETGYYPPPSNPSLVAYDEANDTLFCTIGGDAYWSIPGLYHIFEYNSTAGEYQNVNTVFLGKEAITSIKTVGEKFYFGSVRTWIRLGGSPNNWTWTPTQAVQGPINNDVAQVMDSGIPFPCVDGKIRFFDGYNCRPILEEFVFSTIPGNLACAAFDGRYYYLFYEDPVYPMLIIDFLRFPQTPPKIALSTYKYASAYYDKLTGKLYVADSRYIRQGFDSSQSVSLTLLTAEVPPEDLTKLGGMTMLVLRINTNGDNLVVTPIFDGVPSSNPASVSTPSLQFVEIPLSFGDCYALSFQLNISSTKNFILQEPMMLRYDG